MVDIALRATERLGTKETNDNTKLYDVSFYPYTAPGVDPIFAVCGDRHTFVCRTAPGKETAIETLQWFEDEDKDHNGPSLNSLVWSRDAMTGDPLLLVAGVSPKIKVLNVKTGELARTLIGHGAPVNDLKISPLSPQVLASCSADRSIRLWNLNPSHRDAPTTHILAGAGHKEQILSISFHYTGRYLLSGGIDTMVNLWVLPSLTGNEEPPSDGKVARTHYPHFSTLELHHDMVDCIEWYGDLILSRATREGKIILWKIDGFSSSADPPSLDAAPIANYKAGYTRSCFGGKFQILLQFSTPLTDVFYMRFGLFHQPEKRPILVAGNEKSKFSFWDLRTLEEEHVPVVGKGKARLAGRQDAHPTDDPFKPLPPMREYTVPKVSFVTRQVAWSNCGEWCVAVGDWAMVCLFQRGKKGGE
ncbi:hypothetical protein LTS18_005956 [Coniosporium uncinatum]|uniref:Uncharacterized protein n=1 Tax=Coniosporium uncinatum TaxID=93489 RepID=A0ACC3D430_9PEZI|nr:hypothetical protein LTS18_005956 [Coniosporium uncinatum]